jgi:hypothetical protein
MKLRSFWQRLFQPGPDALAQLRKLEHDAWWANFALICAENGEKSLAETIVKAHQKAEKEDR